MATACSMLGKAAVVTFSVAAMRLSSEPSLLKPVSALGGSTACFSSVWLAVAITATRPSL